MSDWAIRVENVGKAYRLSRPSGLGVLKRGLTSPLRRALGGPSASREEELFWALRNVSFEVKRGEVVGVIGRNGAGKSTLLKLFSRITAPTEGRIEIRGRVGSLLEVGTGFHPDLTGRENVFLNGAILGMTRQEVASKFDEIVAFAEIERFIDQPVKHYSSGMYTRLAFAVAAHLETEILIVDEVLAVGDAAFQRKCLGKMGSLSGSGRTVLFVSHNMGAVRTLTQSCVYLQQGWVAAAGPTGEVADRYVHDSLDRAAERTGDLSYFRRNDNPDAAARFLAVRILGGIDGSNRVPVRQPFGFELDIEFRRALADPFINIVIKREDGEAVTSLLSGDHSFCAGSGAGVHTVRCEIESLQLLPGRYSIDLGIGAQVGRVAWDVILSYPAMEVINAGATSLASYAERPGSVLCPQPRWALLRQSPAPSGQRTATEPGAAITW